MKRTLINMLLLLPLLLAAGMTRQETSQPPRITFASVQIWIDSHDQSLAAYQLEFKASSGDVKIVGIEGGDPAPFKAAPYYDPAAMQQERVIIAAFSTVNASSLPTGRSRIATIHLQNTGDVKPEFTTNLAACATANGKSIRAEVILKTGQSS